ncbi:MAG: PqqD family protein [Melioribacter sp.]|uniref:PqqD family protein n=1 Tax=Rosettibacter primus TaxID=3111523 RepID=UPI00247CDAC8|nr:PqqD family protein [Melioribacter sp.]
MKSANYLELTPVHLMKYESDENNFVTIHIPKFNSSFSFKYIMPRLKNPFIKLKLDELGSAAWLEIDGKKKVLEIADRLTQKFGSKVQPVEERLTKFLTQLYEQRLITFEEIKGE